MTADLRLRLRSVVCGPIVVTFTRLTPHIYGYRVTVGSPRTRLRWILRLPVTVDIAGSHVAVVLRIPDWTQ